MSLVFPFSIDDPLAAEHALVNRWVREAVASLPVGRYYEDVDLKDSPSGRDLLASSAERGRLIVQAALVQAKYWHTTTELLRERGVRDGQGTNLTQVAGWSEARGGETKTIAVIAALLRRSLPIDRIDLLQLLEWLMQRGRLFGLPLGYATKSLERYAATHEIDAELGEAIRRFATVLRQDYSNDAKRLATAVDQLCASLPHQDDEDEPGELREAPVPSAAGDPLVLLPLKNKLGMLPTDASAETTLCGPDRYAMPTDSPLASEHALLTKLLEQKIQVVKYGTEMDAFAAGQAILGLNPSARSKVLVAAIERHMASLMGPNADCGAVFRRGVAAGPRMAQKQEIAAGIWGAQVIHI